MGVFVIVTLPGASENRAAVEAAIVRVFPADHLKLADDKWLVAGDGTAMDIYARLTGGPNINTIGTVLVSSMLGYWGVAPSNVWEWIAAKSSPKHAAATTR